MLTGANGYIGSHLLLALVTEGHHITALIRSPDRFTYPKGLEGYVTTIVADLMDQNTLNVIPHDIDAAYYLVHSMGLQSTGFSQNEAACARNFSQAIEKTSCKQIIYLSGLAAGKKLSEHMSSRHAVEKILFQNKIPTTVLRCPSNFKYCVFELICASKRP